MDIKGKKTHRHEDNPIEKVFHDTFIKRFVTHPNSDGVARIVNDVDGRGNPSEHLSVEEIENTITTIQWLGSHVGQGFLRECGFELKIKQ